MALQAMRRCRHRLVYDACGDAGGGSVVWTTNLINSTTFFGDSHFPFQSTYKQYHVHSIKAQHWYFGSSLNCL